MSVLNSENGPKRQGENGGSWYRSERIYRNLKGWYFHTREGVEVGPFKCRFDAEVDLEALIRTIKHMQGPSVLKAIHSQAVTASCSDYLLSSSEYTGYLVAEGGPELLQEATA